MPANAAMGQPQNPKHFLRYDAGPAGYLADLVLKVVAGNMYPAKVSELVRPWRRQYDLRKHGFCQFDAGNSPHEIWLGFELCHDRFGMFDEYDVPATVSYRASGGRAGYPGYAEPPDGAPFWQCVEDAVRMVNEKTDAGLVATAGGVPGVYHLENWQELVASWPYEVEPMADGMRAYFLKRALPKVWARYETDHPSEAAAMLRTDWAQ